MKEIENEKDILNMDYLDQEAQNNFISNENMNNEDYINYNLNNLENNNEYEKNNDVNNDIKSTQEAFVQTLNLQIKQLQDLLEEKNKEFDNINSENNKLKLLLIQEQKKLIDKENALHSLNIQKNKLDEKMNTCKIESENMQSKIKELNYQLIELKQNIISKENKNQFYDKIKNIIENNNDKENNLLNENYEIELRRLNNKIDELEIKNNKLVFDNKILNQKINSITNDKNTEVNTYKSIYQNEINNLNKLIINLSNRISKILSEKINFSKNKKSSNFLKKEILEKFNELENRLNLYDKENCELRKENQNIKSELEEMKLVGESKEKIIQKLQTDFELMENEYNNNLFYTQKTDNIPKMTDINKSQYINDLVNKQKMLIKENSDLKYGLKQMTNNINEASQLYSKKKVDYDKNLEARDKKLKEYKTKITLLKMKIKELHHEISILKEYKGDFLNNNHISFLTQNNNDINKEQKKMSFTPKVKRNRQNYLPFEINLENKNENNNEYNNNIFEDIKISEIPKENNSIKPSEKDNTKNDLPEKEKKNNNEKKIDISKLANSEQDFKFLQDYKDTLKKIDEQLKKYNS